MNQETKICQNCKRQFVIEPEDLQFYERIEVPAPTWCPECRLIRRMLMRNERTISRRKCNLCHKNIISTYHESLPFPVYCRDCWFSDTWDDTTFGREYDFSRPFFEQLLELKRVVPHRGFHAINCTNCNYIGFGVDSKNCYLGSSLVRSEEVLYSNQIDDSRECVDCFNITRSELLYWAMNTERSHRSSFLLDCRECLESAFLFDCVNCQNCFMSHNLRNRKFMFRDIQLNKEDYSREISKIKFSSYQENKKLKQEFSMMMTQHSIHKFANVTKVENVSGNFIVNCKNVHNFFYAHDSENVKYGIRAISMKDSMDINYAGGELMYEMVSPGALTISRQQFCVEATNSIDTAYSQFTYDCSNTFGCVGLRNKQYCILNKQYTKEEYEKLVSRIIKHMDEMPYTDRLGRVYKYGEFFPTTFSPFAYNESVAQEYFPLSKEEAVKQGYQWRDSEAKKYPVTKTADQLSDDMQEVSNAILEETIQCSHNQACNHQCTQAFRIIPQELQFYKRMNLPLPRLCPNCRHYERLKRRNPLKLWHRQCQCAGEKSENGAYKNSTSHRHGRGHCLEIFETSYAPDRSEIVYCETCYNAEIV